MEKMLPIWVAVEAVAQHVEDLQIEEVPLHTSPPRLEESCHG